MLSIKEAKARSRILKTFLKERSIEMPHGVVLEAIARLEHHKNWASFLASANAIESLQRVFADVQDWPTFVFFFDEREEDNFKEKLFVMPAGTTLNNAPTGFPRGAIDGDGAQAAPKDFLGSKVVVVEVHSLVPSIDAYGMPSFADHRAAAFFREELGCGAIDDVQTSVRDCGDDSAARYWFEARVEPAHAELLQDSNATSAPDSAPVASPVLTDQQLTDRAYEKVFLRVFTDTNDVAHNRIMEAVSSAWFSDSNAERYLQQTVDSYITLNGPYDLLDCRALFARLKALAKTEFQKLLLAQTASK